MPQYRILIFAPAFAPLANPEAIVNSKLALSFLNAGWEIEVITRNLGQEWKNYNYGSEWVEPWIRLKEITHILSYESGNKLHRLIDTAWSGLRTQYAIPGCRWAVHAVDLALKMHRQKPFDLIMTRSLPDAAHLAGMLMSRKTGLPWIANWNDPSGDKHPLPYGKGPKANLGYFYERMLREVSQRASWHTFPSERMRNYIINYLNIESKPNSSTIPHVSLKMDISGVHKQVGVFTICYAGYLSQHRNPEILLKGIAEFISVNRIDDSFSMSIIGLDNVGIQALAVKNGIERFLQVLGSVSYMESSVILSQSDVLVVLEAPCEEGIYLPAKFIDYVQNKRPILAITPKNSEVAGIISSYGGGIAVDCLSVKEIALALTQMYENWKNGTLDTQYSSDVLQNMFSPETIISHYEEIFTRIIKAKQ